MLLRALVAPFMIGGLVMARTPAAGGRVELQGWQPATERAFARADKVPAGAHMAPASGDTVRVRADTVREFRGLYETGFEVSWFHACDAPPDDDTWWVTLTNDALRQRDSLTKTLTGHPRTLLVRWRGTVSPTMPMGAGHMGRGSRYMLVSEVISVRASDESGCTSA
jgi:hypothetical protein